MTVLHLLIFCDFDPTEAYRSVVLQMAPQFGFFWCFLMIGLKLYFFGKNIPCVPHPFIFRGCMLLCPLTGDVNLDWLVKVMSAGCPSNVKSFFPLQWMNLGGDTLGVGKYPFLLSYYCDILMMILYLLHSFIYYSSVQMPVLPSSSLSFPPHQPLSLHSFLPFPFCFFFPFLLIIHISMAP